jgi:hypothetical protein
VGRRYVLSGENLTLSTGNVLAALQSASSGAGSIIEIERVEISQSHNATSAQVRVGHGQRNTAGTITVTSATPNPIPLGGPASGISGGTNPATAATCGVNSSADSGGTYTSTIVANPNNLGGYVWIPIPEHKIILPPSTLYVVRLLATPSDTAGWTVAVWYHEVV